MWPQFFEFNYVAILRPDICFARFCERVLIFDQCLKLFKKVDFMKCNDAMISFISCQLFMKYLQPSFLKMVDITL